MSKTSVVITGYGVVSPFGAGVDVLMSALRDGRSGVRSLAEQGYASVDGTYCSLGAPVPDDLAVKSIPRKHRRSMGRGAIFAQLAANEALASAGLGDETLRGGRAGVAVGSTITSPSSLAEFFDDYLVEKSVRQVPANGFFRVMGNSAAANVANSLGVTGRVHSTPAACASGVIAQGLGFELIANGIQDVMICGGVEELHPTTAAIFDTVGASSTHFNEHPERTPAPFDRDRDGTVCGEGAGMLVLEREDHARDRGATILASVLGFGSTADGENMAQPGVSSMATCMEVALADAGLGAHDIDYVSAHGTATEQGDRAEAEAIHRVLGPSVPVSSLKGHLGHTLGGSGAIEAVAAIEMMRGGYLVPTAKLANVAPECACITHVLALEERRVEHLMKCSFGFGGTNGAIVIGRYSDATL